MSSSSENSNSRRGSQNEIPTEQNIEETEKFIEKQDKVPGEKRDDETVTDYPEAAAMGRVLRKIGFPADKNKIIQFVQKEQESNLDCKEVLPLVQKLEERSYENAFEVTKAAGLVRRDR